VYQQYKGNICNRAFKCGSELPEYVALILRNGGSQSPDRWLRELRNNHFVLEQLSDLDSISYRAMMGEYILYYRDKIVGGIYDDRLLVKPVSSAISLMPTTTYELPYEGAKEMLLVDDVDNREFLCNLFLSMYDELPAPKKKKTTSKK
jgi:TfoX/Sxy family transcriptional regulator of competence genes